MNKPVGSYIVSWDFSHEYDKNVLLVGEQVNGNIKIVNAFMGADAHDIYEKLTKIKTKDGNGEA